MPDQNAMDQFNAIRARAQSGNIATPQQPDNLPTADQSEPRSMQYVIPNPNNPKEPLLTVYSNSGPHTQDEFNKALDIYDAKGNVSGFSVLKPGMMGDIRSTFESAIGNPMRNAASAIRGTPDMPASSPYIPDVIQSPVATLANKLKRGMAAIPEGMSTPQGFGATAGTAAAALASGGVTALPMILRTAIGAGLGSAIGDIATGVHQGDLSATIGDATATTLMAAAFQGGASVLKVAFGMGMSQRAQQTVAEDLMSVIKDKFRPLINDPQAIDAMLSTPVGVRDAVQAGVKGLRNSADDMAQSFLSDLQSQLPRNVKSATATEVKELFSGLVDKQNAYLDAIDNPKMMKTLVRDMKDIGGKIESVIRKEFNSSKSVENQVLKAQSLVDDFVQSTSDFTSTAQVFAALKRSGAARGFDAGAFQREIQPYFKNPAYGDMMQQAGNAAFRGSSGTATDAATNLGVPLGSITSKIPLINMIPGVEKMNIPIIPGTKYVGHVRGAYPVTTATAASVAQQGSTDVRQQATTIKSIKDYLGQ